MAFLANFQREHHAITAIEAERHQGVGDVRPHPWKALSALRRRSRSYVRLSHWGGDFAAPLEVAHIIPVNWLPSILASSNWATSSARTLVTAAASPTMSRGGCDHKCESGDVAIAPKQARPRQDNGHTNVDHMANDEPSHHRVPASDATEPAHPTQSAAVPQSRSPSLQGRARDLCITPLIEAAKLKANVAGAHP